MAGKARNKDIAILSGQKAGEWGMMVELLTGLSTAALPFQTEIMRQLWAPPSKMALRTSLAGFNPEKVPLFRDYAAEHSNAPDPCQSQ
jgi:hypothetical protein